MFARVEAVTLDFFDTLIFHREGRGRGWALVNYLEAQGWAHDPWEHQVLYDVFADHDTGYAPDAPVDERATYHVQLAQRVFDRLQVEATAGDAARHAEALWEILGPASFGVFPDAPALLRTLRDQGYPLALISNWQRGLRHFCAELGLAGYFDHILGSADFGVAKPDGRIFEEACARLGAPPDRVLHVGDSLIDDYRGGQAAGLAVMLLDRDGGPADGVAHVIHGLAELPPLLER